MSLTSILYRFTIDLSNVENGLYETIEFRAAMHPSESIAFFMTRMIAFCLNYQEGLEFSAGISAPEDPAIYRKGLRGQIDLWIDIGNPSAKRIHKASKSVSRVKIYTHKDIQKLAEDLQDEKVHKLETLGLFSIDPKFLNRLGETLQRDNHWEMTFHEGELYIGVGKESFQSRVETYLWDSRP